MSFETGGATGAFFLSVESWRSLFICCASLYAEMWRLTVAACSGTWMSWYTGLFRIISLL